MVLLSGCNVLLADRCETLCADVAARIEECMTASSDWPDYGAANRSDYTRECRQDWDDVSGDLTSRELEVALEVCRDTREEVGTLSCPEIRALYSPL